MINKEEIEDLQVLLEMLQLKDEYLYTNTLNKVKMLLEKSLNCDNVDISTRTVQEYDTLKLDIYLGVKVGLSYLTRVVQPPYLIDLEADTKYYEETYKDRFKTALVNIYTVDYLYGALTNDSKINENI